MKRRTKIWLGVAAVALGGIGVSAKKAHDEKEQVEVESRRVERKDLRSLISASGKIKPRNIVDVSAAVSGKVLDVLVKDGDEVKKDQLLLRLDPKPFVSQVQQLEASIETAKANIDLQKANLVQSQTQLKRTESLSQQGLVTDDQLDRERTGVAVEAARLKATEQEIPRLQASLEEAKHELTKVDIHSDIDGIVCGVNIHPGEFAFVGAFNNPATVMLTVANLDVIEAEVEVDETEAVRAQPNQYAEVEVDAHREFFYKGHVTEVGHSPLTKQQGAEREGTSYLVKVLVEEAIPGVRPGMTCSAKIRTDERKSVLAVPIQAITLRKPRSEAQFRHEGGESETSTANAAEPPAKKTAPSPVASDASVDPPAETGVNGHRKKDEEGKVEGVFVVRDHKAWFQPIKRGLTGEKDFEILAGLDEGTELIVGPYKALHTLKDGDKVRPPAKKDDAASGATPQ